MEATEKYVSCESYGSQGIQPVEYIQANDVPFVGVRTRLTVLNGKTNNMILIGLTGGKPEQRKEIAERLERFGESRLKTWAGTDARRAARLRDLVIALNDAKANKALGGIVACNVMTQEEAQEIRRRGGVIWHVMGTPSESVPMERDDPKVTHMQGGCRHFLDVLDAFYEHRLSIAAL